MYYYFNLIVDDGYIMCFSQSLYYISYHELMLEAA